MISPLNYDYFMTIVRNILQVATRIFFGATRDSAQLGVFSDSRLVRLAPQATLRALRSHVGTMFGYTWASFGLDVVRWRLRAFFVTCPIQRYPGIYLGRTLRGGGGVLAAMERSGVAAAAAEVGLEMLWLRELSTYSVIFQAAVLVARRRQKVGVRPAGGQSSVAQWR